MITKNWNFFRILRLVLGLIIVGQGIVTHDLLFGIAGGFLSLMAIANIGCCGPAGCGVNPKYNRNNKETEVVYEEVDNSK